MTGSSDSRRDERHALLLRVERPDGSSAHDFTENLSAGGLFLRTDRPLRVGERVPLLVGFPRLLPPVEIEVEVVRVRLETPEEPAGVAVRVPDDRPADRARFSRIAEAACDQGAAPRTCRILVAEDNALVEALYASALERLSPGGAGTGIEVEFVRDGAEAIARLERAPRIDLLLLDLFMPVVDGFEVAARLRAMPELADVPVVAISAGNAEARERALAAGVDLFLRKPVKVQDVLGTVRALLRLR
jgi:uncharacterized protein (TIGR02266 family)